MPDRTILLVEDDPADEALTLRALRQNNVANDIAVVRDGEEALNYLFGEEQETGPAEPPTVVLLDLRLPKVDGLEVLRLIRADERTKLIPVIVLTSSREEADLVKSYSLGANSYVCKPVDFVQFAEAIRELGLYWLILNEPPVTRRAVLST